MLSVGRPISRFWTWDAQAFLRPYENALVWVMILLFVVTGAGPTLFVGLLAAVGIALAELSAIPVVATKTNLGNAQSHVLRPSKDRALLQRHAAETEIWILGVPYLFFASARQLVEALEERKAAT